jgi:predicted DCC family thiol-disulfide oxidoreductase YuxK
VRSEAVLGSVRQVGGLWAIVAALGAIVPRPLADRLYDGVARLRHRLFRPPTDACPAVPARLRERLLP